MTHANLAEAIIALSKNQTSWTAAKAEWRLASVYREADPSTCLCGHFPIIEICVLQNVENGRSAEVGNICVHKFMSLPSNQIFAAIKRIQEDDTRSVNEATIDFVRSKGWINAWESKFLISTMRKRNLSGRQLMKRLEINAMILAKTKR